MQKEEVRKTRTLFVYPNHIGDRRIRLGIGYLSSYLKKFGHKTELLDLTFGYNQKDSFKKIRSFKPELIAFSVLSMEFDFATQVAKDVKENLGIPIVFGGIHPTIAPEETIKNENVDMVCIGEGEHTLLELVEKMESGRNIKKILGLWIKEKGKIFKNGMSPPETNLDKFPFPDREIFDRRQFIKDSGSPFLTSRGCPYQCSYCCNHILQKIYDYKNYVRFRSIDSVIEEIKFVQKKYRIKSVYITDDTFTLRKDRVIEFCKKYQDEIGLPFKCQTNPSSIDKETMIRLKDAGCVEIEMGIESGNDKIRNKIMNRHFTKQQLINAFSNAKDVGLKTYSFNILGVPSETRATVMETINLNRECKADVSQSTIFYPFPYTKLWEISKKFITERKTISYYNDSILNLPTIERKELVALQRTFQMYVRFPKYLWFVPFALEKIIRYSPESMNDFYRNLLTLTNLILFSPEKERIFGKMGNKLLEGLKVA